MRSFENITRYHHHIIAGGIFIVSMIVYSFLATRLPLNYDEAFNLQVPVSLSSGQGYNTIYTLEPFDGLITISTGPVVLVPPFLVFKLSGVGVLRARLIQVIYASVFLVVFWILSVRRYRFSISAFLFLLLLTSSYIFEYGIPVMGELPGMAFLFSGMVLWGYGEGKHKKSATLIMGFSVIAKPYFVFVILPILFVDTLRLVRTHFDVNLFFKEISRSFGLFFIPLGIWEAIKFLYLGLKDYQSYLEKAVHFASHQTNDIAKILEITPDRSANVWERLNTVFEGTFPGLPVVITAMLFVSFLIRFSYLTLRKNGWDENSSVLFLAYSILITYFFWFLFISINGWWRYFFPFSILCIFLLGDLFTIAYKYTREKGWFHYLVWIPVGAGLCFYLVTSLIRQYEYIQKTSSPNQLDAQREFSSRVSTYYERGYDICVFGWWQAPEISFLAGGIKFNECSACQYKARRTVVIFTALQEAFDPQGAAAKKSCLGNQIVESRYGQFSLYAPASSAK